MLRDLSRPARRIVALVGLVAATLSLQASGCLNFSIDAGDPSGPPWDTDNDEYTYAVETDPANVRLYAFNTNAHDPHWSFAHGTPLAGTLQDGIRLPWVNLNYYSYSQDNATRQWGTRWLVWAIEETARRWDGNIVDEQCFWETTSSPYEFGVGDMSRGNEPLRTFGGSFEPDHHSHQNGLDVDVRFLRKDGLRAPVNLTVHADSLAYDVYATVDLLHCFINNPNVTRILIDTAYANIITDDYGIIVHDTGHRNHFHVRINDGDGEGN